ncbi:hypothetical protein Tco_1436394 [Tanacetum coccineum]
MELIQTTIPILVDGVHTCIRVCEILGECDEICGSKNKIDNESDNDSCTNHGENVDDDDGENGEDGDANEEDDDIQDGDDYSPFINEGGWIREDMTEKSLEDIESSPENNSKFPANSSPLMRKSDNETFDCFVKNNQIEVRLPPHACHEAAFTRIASTWGEIIFPEKCNPCRWVCEILGECDEICGSKNKTDNESDNDSCTNHGENVDDGDANEEDDDFQDGDDYSPFINEGGWIREDMTEKSLEDIESSPKNNSKFPANSSPMKLLIVLSKITKSREEEVSREHIESFVGCSLNPSISPIQLPGNSTTTPQILTLS